MSTQNHKKGNVMNFRTWKQFSSLYALYQYIPHLDNNRATLSTTLNTILFATGHLTQQR